MQNFENEAGKERERERNNIIICLEHQKVPRKIVQDFNFFILLILNKF